MLFRSDAKDYIAGFPDHPHRGFETVTYMLAGRMRHEDNKGNRGLLRPGSVQWMTAGRGIVHSELPEQENGLMWGFQLWVNLPARDKMCEPRYQEIAPEEVPEVAVDGGGKVRVIAGSVGGTVGPISGVEVRVSRRDTTLPNASNQELATVFTNGRGEFLVRVPSEGLYFAYPYAASYTASPGMVTGKSVDGSHPRAEFNFELARLGDIIGRVVDAM